MILQLSVAYYALSGFWSCCLVFYCWMLDELNKHPIGAILSTVKLVVLLDLGTKEFVEQESYFSENVRVAVILFKLRSLRWTSLMLFLLVTACTRMLVLPSWLSGVLFPSSV